MKSLLLPAFAAGFALLALPIQGQAQSVNPPAPVTRILAIGTLTPGADLAGCARSFRSRSKRRSSSISLARSTNGFRSPIKTASCFC